MQEGLAQYEQSAGRVEFRAPEANLSDAIRKLEADRKTDRSKPTWLIALEQVRLPLYDVHWTPAVVVEKRTYQGGDVDPRRPARTAAACRCRPAAAGPAPGSGSTTSSTSKSSKARSREARPAAAAAAAAPASSFACGRPCRASPWCWRTDRARAGDGRRLLLSAEPAQPRHPGAAAARLLVQADDLSRGAQQRPAAQHAGRRRADHLSADRRHQPLHARHRLLVAAQLRRRLFRHDDDPPRAGACPRTWRRRACSTAASPASRPEPRRDLQARDRGARLSEMRAVLSVRARRPAGAADRPRGVLCRDRQRGQTPDAACDRADHAGRPRSLQGRRKADAARRASIRRRCSSSARSCKAWWRAAPPRA